MVNEAGYATGFVEWAVSSTTYQSGEWENILRDPAGNLYHTRHTGRIPSVAKLNSIGVEQCTGTVTGIPTNSGISFKTRGLEIDSENNLYLIGYVEVSVNGETALGGYRCNCCEVFFRVFW